MVTNPIKKIVFGGFLTLALGLQMGCSAPFRAVGAVTKMVANTTSTVAKAGANVVGTGVRAGASAVQGAVSNPGAAAPLLMGLEAEEAQAEPPIEP
jgi:altronate dehydratase